MDKSAQITIFGAGAIGCTLAVSLIHAGFNRVSVIARGQNLEVLKQQGMYLTDLTGEYHVRPYQVVESVDELSPQDFIFICTKSDALKTITPSISKLVHAETMVIPMLNGIPFWYFYSGTDTTSAQVVKSLDADGFLQENFPFKHLIGAVVFITAELLDHGRVKSNNPYLLILGEPNHAMSERLGTLENLFQQTAIEVRLHEQIRDQIWTKVLANLSSNPLSVLTGATLKQIYSDPELISITHSILQEIRLVASSYGARIQFDPTKFLQLGADMGEIHTSMWHDFQQKKPLELSSIADAVFELAEHFQISMPMTEKIVSLTRFVSENSRNNNQKGI